MQFFTCVGWSQASGEPARCSNEILLDIAEEILGHSGLAVRRQYDNYVDVMTEGMSLTAKSESDCIRSPVKASKNFVNLVSKL